LKTELLGEPKASKLTLQARRPPAVVGFILSRFWPGIALYREVWAAVPGGCCLLRFHWSWLFRAFLAELNPVVVKSTGCRIDPRLYLFFYSESCL
jgi:hypothetical protein